MSCISGSMVEIVPNVHVPKVLMVRVTHMCDAVC